jgi:threonine dehydrogenase-like Zn-dependent dehydrogenase
MPRVPPRPPHRPSVNAWEVRHGVLDLHELPAAHPQPGEVVVDVSHVGICGSDLPKLLRPDQFALPEPWRPGHEIVGVDSTGRTVAVDPLMPCSTCPRCLAGDSHLCHDLRRLGWELPGGFATQVTIPAENVHPLPVGVDPLHAVLADPAAVAIHGLRCSPIGWPGRLAVIGAGTVGLITALYAHEEGWTVSVFHRDDHAPPAALTTALPAAFVSPATLNGQGDFDVVIDAASGANPAPLELAVRLVRDGGVIIVQNAYHPRVTLPTQLRDLFRRSIRLVGSFSYCRREPTDFALALRLLSRHSTTVSQLIASGGKLGDLPTLLASRITRSVRLALFVKPT